MMIYFCVFFAFNRQSRHPSWLFGLTFFMFLIPIPVMLRNRDSRPTAFLVVFAVEEVSRRLLRFETSVDCLFRIV
jgi:hypothetical protein